MEDNLPKKLIVDPIGKKDVEALIAEALKGFAPSKEPEYLNIGEGISLSFQEVQAILEKVVKGEIVLVAEAAGYHYINVNDGAFLYLEYKNAEDVISGWDNTTSIACCIDVDTSDGSMWVPSCVKLAYNSEAAKWNLTYVEF